MASVPCSSVRVCVDAHSANDCLPLRENRSFREKIDWMMEKMAQCYCHPHINCVQQVSMDVAEIGTSSWRSRYKVEKKVLMSWRFRRRRKVRASNIYKYYHLTCSLMSMATIADFHLLALQVKTGPRERRAESVPFVNFLNSIFRYVHTSESFGMRWIIHVFLHRI